MTLSAFILSMSSFFANANTTDDEWNMLIKAISAVESGHNQKAVNGQYVGILQIGRGCVMECNKIVGHQKYTYNDRYNPEKSIEMFQLIQGKYNPDRDLEKAARIWNGGPGSLKRPKCTDGYWNKVKRIMDNMRKA